jgi:hypothetical protein
MSRFFSPLSSLKSVDESTSDTTSVESQESVEYCRSRSVESTTTSTDDEKGQHVSEFYFDLSERWATAYLEKADEPLYPPEESSSLGGDDIGTSSKISTFMRRISSTQPLGSKSSTTSTSKRSLFATST